MGMFDYVKFKCLCPVCKEEVEGFQSKSGRCLLDTVNFTDVDEFHANCDKCGTWITYFFKKPDMARTINDYELTYIKKKEVK